jgi:hypothetical protein
MDTKTLLLLAGAGFVYYLYLEGEKKKLSLMQKPALDSVPLLQAAYEEYLAKPGPDSMGFSGQTAPKRTSYVDYLLYLLDPRTGRNVQQLTDRGYYPKLSLCQASPHWNSGFAPGTKCSDLLAATEKENLAAQELARLGIVYPPYSLQGQDVESRIAAGTYKGSEKYQRRQAQRAAAQAKKSKAATFTPPPPPAPPPAPTASEVLGPLVPCPEGFYPHQGGCMRESISGQSPEEIQAGNDAVAAWSIRNMEEGLALLTEAVGRGDLRAVKDVIQRMNPSAPSIGKTYEEWLAQTAQTADIPGMAEMVTLSCTQDPTGANTQIGPNSQGCQLYTLINQVAHMAKAEVAKTNPLGHYGYLGY